MARRPTERYVRYYTIGSTSGKAQKQLPKDRQAQPKKIIEIEPVAVAGNLVAVSLAALMAVGMMQVHQVNTEIRQMEAYIIGLERTEEKLEAEYKAGYDLEEVRLAAEKMGMIPAEDAVRVSVRVPEEQVEVVQLSWWETLLVNLRRFFGS